MNKDIRNLLSEIETLKAEAKTLIQNNRLEEAEQVKAKIIDLREKEIELKAEYKADLNRIENRTKGVETMENTINRAIKNAIYPNEKISTETVKAEMDFGKLVKGMAKGNWAGAEQEQRFFNMNTSGTGSVTIPQVLANKILDKAREQSALFGKVPVVAMEHNNLKIAIQTGDATAHFVAEGEEIPSSETTFASVELNGKDLAIYIPVTEKLLDSASNLEEQLVQATAKAIANALDKAMLYGAGENSIIGLENIEEVQKIEHTEIDPSYDCVIVGAKAIKKKNIVPTNVAFNSDFAADLDVKKDSNGRYIERPAFMDRYDIAESNNVKDSQVVVYDVNSLLLGINKNITVQWGYVGNDFQSLKKGLRVHLRADFIPTRTDGVVLVNSVRESLRTKKK